MTHHQKIRQSIDIKPKVTGRLEFIRTNFKTAILSIFKDLKENLVRITITDKAYQQRNENFQKEPNGTTTTKNRSS